MHSFKGKTKKTKTKKPKRRRCSLKPDKLPNIITFYYATVQTSSQGHSTKGEDYKHAHLTHERDRQQTVWQ